MWPNDVPAKRKNRLGNVWDSTDEKLAVADRERAVQAVVEGEILPRIVAHTPATRGIRGHRVGSRESVHPSVVVLVVGTVPRMVEVGLLAGSVLVVRVDRLAAREIRIRRAERLGIGPRLSLKWSRPR